VGHDESGRAGKPPPSSLLVLLEPLVDLCLGKRTLQAQLLSPNGHVNLLNRPRAVPAMVLMCICECECVGLCDRSNAGSRPHVTRRRVTRGHLFSETCSLWCRSEPIRDDVQTSPKALIGPAHHVPAQVIILSCSRVFSPNRGWCCMYPVCTRLLLCMLLDLSQCTCPNHSAPASSAAPSTATVASSRRPATVPQRRPDQT
jgi:hypothetical protein